MKVRASVKKICEKCKIVTARVLYVLSVIYPNIHRDRDRLSK